MENIQEPEVTQDTTSPETAPAEPPRKRSHLKIVFIIIGSFFLIILILLVSLFAYLQKNGVTVDKLDPRAVPTSTMTGINNETDIYRNNAHKFSVPYVNDLKVTEKQYGLGVTSVEMRLEDKTKDNGPIFQLLIFPKVIGDQIGQNFDTYYALPDNTSKEIKDPLGITVKFTKIKNRTVNDLRAFYFTSAEVPEQPDIEHEIGVYIEIGNEIMIISTPESNKAELDKMLVDFKYPLN